MSSDVGRIEVRDRVRGMTRGDLKPPGYFKQLPVMMQGEFLSWPPPLLNLLPTLLPDPVITARPPLAEMAFAGLTGSPVGARQILGHAKQASWQGQFIPTARLREWVGKVHTVEQNAAPECWDAAVDVGVATVSSWHREVVRGNCFVPWEPGC